jgi:hypothetical protein
MSLWVLEAKALEDVLDEILLRLGDSNEDDKGDGDCIGDEAALTGGCRVATETVKEFEFRFIVVLETRVLLEEVVVVGTVDVAAFVGRVETAVAKVSDARGIGSPLVGFIVVEVWEDSLSDVVCETMGDADFGDCNFISDVVDEFTTSLRVGNSYCWLLVIGRVCCLSAQ